MAEHQCEQSSIIAEIRSDVKGLVVSQAKVEQLLIGNGVPGLAATVGDHGKRLDDVEDAMLTQDAVKSMLKRQAALIATGLGLVLTIIGIAQALIPRLK